MFNIHAEIRDEIYYLYFFLFWKKKSILQSNKYTKKGPFSVNLPVKKIRNFQFNMSN